MDLHNTIYDEVMEYGLALNEAIIFWQETAQKFGKTITRERLYAELSIAHQELASDWDEDVWSLLPALQELNLSKQEFTQLCEQAIYLRRVKSQELTKKTVYTGLVETLKKLKSQGVRIYIITEATADIAMQALDWLRLGGVVQGVYTYPSRHAPVELEGTYHKVFSNYPNSSTYLKKPHPFLLADLSLDDAKLCGKIPNEVKTEEVFSIVHDENLELKEFAKDMNLQADVSVKLQVRAGQYAEILQEILQDMLYVGDSKFKDGIMAQNAGVKFAWAAYGKQVAAEAAEDFEQSKQILYAVTGWDKQILQLTQEASKSQRVHDLQPDFVLENPLSLWEREG